jgi:hypothetical protein
MNKASISQFAPSGSCTPTKMADAGVPFDAALTFHTQLARRGPRTRTELNVFNCVRAMVARSP